MDWDIDDIDRRILSLLQDNCKRPLAKIGEEVGLSAPSVQERVKKLEDHGVICGYRAVLDARLVGKDVTAFIGVSIRHPRGIDVFEESINVLEDVLECHHVTGSYTLMLKVKSDSTSTLEELISRIRSIDEVERTETMVVLSTHTERTRVPIAASAARTPRRARRTPEKQAASL